MGAKYGYFPRARSPLRGAVLGVSCPVSVFFCILSPPFLPQSGFPFPALFLVWAVGGHLGGCAADAAGRLRGSSVASGPPGPWALRRAGRV